MVNISHIDIVVIGGGQAGIATSFHLTKNNMPHIVLEKNKIADKWRTQRWDSLVTNSPAWNDCFPELAHDNIAPDDFVPKEKVADYFVRYVEKFNLPVHENISVHCVKKQKNNRGFIVETSAGTYHANHIVSATGPYQKPVIPPIAPKHEKLYQIHSTAYFNPEQLPDGAVLVVGAGSSGAQIADELNHAGKTVYFSIGPHVRPPRWYRGRDFAWWLGVLGVWDSTAPAPGMEHMAAPVSGDRGKYYTVDFKVMVQEGITLLGATEKFTDTDIIFKPTLPQDIAIGDRQYLDTLGAMDAYIQANGLDLPPDPQAWNILPDPECVKFPILSLNMKKHYITSIIWATGFTYDYEWLQVDTFDENGTPKHHRGIGACAGIYFVGLPFLSRLGSPFIWGCWHDAKYIADHIALQNKYHALPIT